MAYIIHTYIKYSGKFGRNDIYSYFSFHVVCSCCCNYPENSDGKVVENLPSELTQRQMATASNDCEPRSMEICDKRVAMFTTSQKKDSDSAAQQIHQKLQGRLLTAPTPSPRVHRLKPTSIRKHRTLEDEHFHERKPLMSRTNYLDDSNLQLTSFRPRSFSGGSLDREREYALNGRTALLSEVKRKKARKAGREGTDICPANILYTANNTDSGKLLLP